MTEQKHEIKDDKKIEEEVKMENSKAKAKAEDNKEKKAESLKIKKHEAHAIGKNLHVSKKHSMEIGRFIKNNRIDSSIEMLSEVAVMKRVVPFRGEIPHRKGKIMSGRYPVSAARTFISLLKGLKGNAVVNGLDLDKTRIESVSATWDSRPMRSHGRKGKRVHVVIVAREPGSEKEEGGKNG